MNRRRASSAVAGVVVALALFWLFTRTNAPSGRQESRKPATTSEKLDPGAKKGSSEVKSGIGEIASSNPIPPDRAACRAIFSRALAGRRHDGLIALNLGYLHRSDRRFREMADAFCRQAGADLIPICRELLSEGTSPTSVVLVSMILGHSRRPETFDLLRELATKGRGPPDADDLYSSAVYSIGMIRSPQSAPFLLKLYSETQGAQTRVAGKFGSALMAAVGMCGRDGLAALKESAIRDLPPEWQPDADEGLRAFRWSHLGVVDSPEAFPDLKAIAEGDSDIRLRGMAIAAMGQSSDPVQRASLAELFARDDNPLIRRAIVESLGDAARSIPEEWAAMRERMSAPLSSIFKAARMPSGDQMLDYSLARLAGEARVPEATRFVNEWLRLASAGLYEGEYYWRGVAAQVLGRQGASPERFEAFVSSQKDLSEDDRLDLMGDFYLHSSGTQNAPSVHVEELVRRLEAGLSSDPSPALLLAALSRIPNASAEASRGVELLIARSPEAASKIEAIELSYAAQELAAPALEKTIRSTTDLSVLLHASAAWLEVLPADATGGVPTRDLVKSLFSPESLRSFTGGTLAAHSGSLKAMSTAVAFYYGRFGTPEDLGWLEMLPQTLEKVHGVRDDHLAHFRRRLALECARAADAIRLRSQ